MIKGLGGFRADGGDDRIAGLGGDDLLYAGNNGSFDNDIVDGGDGTDLCVSAESALNCEL